MLMLRWWSDLYERILDLSLSPTSSPSCVYRWLVQELFLVSGSYLWIEGARSLSIGYSYIYRADKTSRSYTYPYISRCVERSQVCLPRASGKRRTSKKRARCHGVKGREEAPATALNHSKLNIKAVVHHYLRAFMSAKEQGLLIRQHVVSVL